MSEIKFLHISAPGKIILCGEHAVVYGKKALACSINLRTHIYVKKLLDSNDNLFQIKFSNLNNKLIKLNENNYLNFKNKYSNEILNIENLIQALKNDNTDDQLNAILLLILQFNNLTWSMISNYEIEISTELPIGAGLGSSASLSSCLVTALLILSKQILLPNSSELKFTGDDLSLINEYTFNLEKFFHGKPSGIDNAVVLNGNYVAFQNGQIIDKFKSNLNLNILIINSNLAKQTREQVAKVRQLQQNYTEIANNLMNSIELISDQVINCLKQTDDDKDDSYSKRLNELIRMNQGLLYSLDISNYKLNSIVNISNKHNYACKITGAGGGGCCFSLINRTKDSDNYEKYLNELQILGNIDYFESLLGCDGIKIEKLLF